MMSTLIGLKPINYCTCKPITILMMYVKKLHASNWLKTTVFTQLQSCKTSVNCR